MRNHSINCAVSNMFGWTGDTDLAHMKVCTCGAYGGANTADRPSISTPIPLTPSDEMVDAALLDYHGPMAWGTFPPIMLQSAKSRMKSALQAALNLMGGKK